MNDLVLYIALFVIVSILLLVYKEKAYFGHLFKAMLISLPIVILLSFIDDWKAANMLLKVYLLTHLFFILIHLFFALKIAYLDMIAGFKKGKKLCIMLINKEIPKDLSKEEWKELVKNI